MPYVESKVRGDRSVPDLAIFPAGRRTQIEEATLEELKKNQVFRAWLDEGQLVLVADDVDELTREEFLMKLLADPRAQMTTDVDPRPTVTWINSKLPQGFAHVSAQERDELWSAR